MSRIHFPAGFRPSPTTIHSTVEVVSKARYLVRAVGAGALALMLGFGGYGLTAVDQTANASRSTVTSVAAEANSTTALLDAEASRGAVTISTGKSSAAESTQRTTISSL